MLFSARAQKLDSFSRCLVLICWLASHSGCACSVLLSCIMRRCTVPCPESQCIPRIRALLQLHGQHAAAASLLCVHIGSYRRLCTGYSSIYMMCASVRNSICTHINVLSDEALHHVCTDDKRESLDDCPMSSILESAGTHRDTHIMLAKLTSIVSLASHA